MTAALLAAAAGAGVAGGILLIIVGVRGRSGPPPARPRLSARLRYLLRGEDRTGRERAARRVQLGAAVIGAGLVWLLTGWPMAGVIFALIVIGLPWLFTVGRAATRRITRLEALESWTRRLSDLVVVGAGLQQALTRSAQTAPAPIQREVTDLATRLRAGWPPRQALAAFADAFTDPSCDVVVAALTMHLADRGERLADVLRSVATSVAEEARTRRIIEAERAEPRFITRFLTAMTLGVLAIGALDTEYIQPYGTPLGQLVLFALTAAFVGLLVWIRNTTRPSLPPRLFTGQSSRRGESANSEQVMTP